MPPKNPWQHQQIKLKNAGLDVLHPFDEVDEFHFSRMEDVKSLQEGDITPRPGVALINAAAIDAPILGSITQALLKEHFDAADASSFQTGAGILFLNSRIYIAQVSATSAGGGAISSSTVSGGNLDWTKIAEKQYSSIASPDSVVALWIGMHQDLAGSDRFFYNFDVTATGAMASVFELGNVDKGGLKGIRSVVQNATFASDATSTPSISLNAFASASNATWATFANSVNTDTYTAGTDFTEISEQSVTGGPSMLVEWKITEDSPADCVISGSSFVGGIAAEIKEQPSTFTYINHYTLTANRSESDATVYTTASVAPTANRLVLLFVTALKLDNSANADPTGVTGGGLTWVKVTGHNFEHQGGETDRTNFSVWRALDTSTPTPATVVVTYAATQARATWGILEFDNVDLGGTNGSAAVVATALRAEATDTGGAPTMAAFGDQSAATVGVTSYAVGNPTFTEQAGMVSLIDEDLSPNGTGTYVQFTNSPELSPGVTLSGAVRNIQVGIELKNAGTF